MNADDVFRTEALLRIEQRFARAQLLAQTQRAWLAKHAQHPHRETALELLRQTELLLDECEKAREQLVKARLSSPERR